MLRATNSTLNNKKVSHTNNVMTFVACAEPSDAIWLPCMTTSVADSCPSQQVEGAERTLAPIDSYNFFDPLRHFHE